MSKKKTILVDMDGVLSDLVKIWLDTYNQESGESLRPSDIHTYEFSKTVKNVPLFYDILHKNSLFLVAEPYGDVSGFKALCENFDVYIVTYVHATALEGHADKIAWFSRVFPWFDTNRIIFVKDKFLVQGDVLIEDSPENIDKWLEANRKGTAICIRAAYNANWHPQHSTRVLMADDITAAESMLRRSFT